MGIFSSLLGGGGMMVPQPANAQMAMSGFPAMAAAQPAKQKHPFAESGFGSILGMIGDALLVANGRAPMYAPQMAQRREMQRQQQTGEALANYLGQLEPGLADLVRNDPGTGLEVYKMMHPGAKEEPETIQLLRAAGIDPASEQGRSLLTSKLAGGGDGPNFIRELQALDIDPHSDEARELYYGRNSPAGYLLRPKGRTASASNGTQGGPPAAAVEHLRSNPSLAAAFDEKYGPGSSAAVLGGPTPSASGSFPR